MKFVRKMSHQIEFIRKLELCPSLLNLKVERYTFLFLLNDILSGVKIFALLFPIAFSLAFFCGASPIQGIVSCAVAAVFSTFIGGSKYQITSVALPLCVVTFEILSKYQYKGMLFVAIFLAVILILFGMLRFSDVLKHLSSAFISAIAVYVAAFIIVDQIQYIFSINTIKSTNGLIENIGIMKGNLDKITLSGFLTGMAYIAPLFLIRLKLKSPISFFLYALIGAVAVFGYKLGLLPAFMDIKTVATEFASWQSFDTIMNVSKEIPSRMFLMNTLNYAFVMAIIIASEVSFCTNVSSSVTGDKRLQSNAELISSGISNFVSVACGGLFVSPNMLYTMKNIEYKSKTIIGILFVGVLSILLLMYSNIVLKYTPVYCISAILLIFAFSIIRNKNIFKFLNFKNADSYVFVGTLITLLYFGFMPAVIVGFMISTIFFAQRMIKIKDASVHTVKNHDTGAIEFMSNKNGFSDSKKIPPHIMDKIEVIQVNNILFLNIAKLVEEGLSTRGSFPSVLIIYFKNVPFLDTDAIESLRDLVKSAKEKDCMVIVSGTNGMLLDILDQKQKAENAGNIFGYIVPDFNEAISKTVKRLS